MKHVKLKKIVVCLKPSEYRVSRRRKKQSCPTLTIPLERKESFSVVQQCRKVTRQPLTKVAPVKW